MTSVSVRAVSSPAVSWSADTDVVVIGAGAAGLTAALESARSGHRVTLVCKSDLTSGCTLYAQGGMAAVGAPGDTHDAHVSDTLAAGAGLSRTSVVRELVGAAPDVVRYLAALGARFDTGDLSLEGGHSHPRIVHAGGDAIGAEVHRALGTAVRESRIDVREHTVGVNLVQAPDGRVVGVNVATVSHDGTLAGGVVTARAVVLATGGFAQAYATCTNPVDVTGDGLAMAVRAGVEVSDLEFVQFHPTVLYLAGRRGQSPLITEALRGAGARIVDEDGVRVMRDVHPRGDLAPRDVVSLAMYHRMHRDGSPRAHLWLDARHLGRSLLATAFPTTSALCRHAGVDPATEVIPIAPGAHYACGGIRASLDGVTSLDGLYVVGEAAATGAHGANRLASNSLTEAVVAGRRAARHLTRFAGTRASREGSWAVSTPEGRGVDSSRRGDVAAAMTDSVGVVRDRRGLENTLDVLSSCPPSPRPLDLATLEATNLHTVSTLVTYSALLREESRGCHQRSDHPETAARWRRSTRVRVVDGVVSARYGVLTT